MTTHAQQPAPGIPGRGALSLSQAGRWAPIAGIAFVALMVSGSFLVSDVPKADASQQEIANYLTDSGNHTRNIIGAYLWALGALRFSGS